MSNKRIGQLQLARPITVVDPHTRDTGIEWTHKTFNPWQGCTKCSPECEYCYAVLQGLRHRTMWGPQAERRIASETTWAEPLAWNETALKVGWPVRVFSASMADVFEGRETMAKGNWEPIEAARQRLWKLIEDTPGLDWQLLTKRPQNVLELVPKAWQQGFPPNVWIGTSVGQNASLEKVAELIQIPAAIRFLSVEPLIAPIDQLDLTGIQWVIAGGESGPSAENIRWMHPDWVRGIRDQCLERGIPFFFKQWGNWFPYDPMATGEAVKMVWHRKKHDEGYDLLDGRTWKNFPQSQSPILKVSKSQVSEQGGAA